MINNELRVLLHYSNVSTSENVDMADIVTSTFHISVSGCIVTLMSFYLSTSCTEVSMNYIPSIQMQH